MMDKISCNIIHDILPLYAENMVCPDTRKLVDEHITQCPGCNSALNEMQKELPIQADESDKPLYSIRKKLRYRKAGAMLLAILISVTMLVLGIVHITSPIYLEYDKSLIAFKEYEDGSVMAILSSDAAGYDIDKESSNGAYTYSITVYNTLWNKYQRDSSETFLILNKNENGGYDKVQGVYYYSYNPDAFSEDKLIYGTKPATFGGRATLPRLVLNYYKLIAAALIVAGIVICILVRNKSRWLKLALIITFIPTAYLISTLLVTGLSSTTYSPVRDLTGILLVMIPLYMALITAAGMIERKKASL